MPLYRGAFDAKYKELSQRKIRKNYWLKEIFNNLLPPVDRDCELHAMTSQRGDLRTVGDKRRPL
jgi:hypothetical protein